MKHLQFLALLLAPIACLAGTSITGSLNVPKQYQQEHPDNYRDVFFKDVVLHLEGSPGTSKKAYATYLTGKFSFHNVEPGHSYILSAESTEMRYKPVRIDINQKGQTRVREADRIDTSRVVKLNSDLITLQPMGKPMFFHPRPKFNLWAVMMGNPMVLMMVVSFGLTTLLPKMVDMDDPETKKEMENSMNMFKGAGKNQQQMPDVAEIMSGLFGSGNKAPASQTRKRN